MTDSELFDRLVKVLNINDEDVDLVNKLLLLEEDGAMFTSSRLVLDREARIMDLPYTPKEEDSPTPQLRLVMYLNQCPGLDTFNDYLSERGINKRVSHTVFGEFEDDPCYYVLKDSDNLPVFFKCPGHPFIERH